MAWTGADMARLRGEIRAREAEIERLTEEVNQQKRGHFSTLEQVQEQREEIERLREALRLFVGCAYPVATEINPRGHAWRPEESLDYALSEAKKVLGSEQDAMKLEER